MSFLHKESGITFESRRQAIKCMGRSHYNKALKNKEFDFNIPKYKLSTLFI